MIHLYDGNNYLRRHAAIENSGLTIRNLVNDMVAHTDPVIVVWDGPQSVNGRRKIYPGYKAQRPETPDDISASLELTRELLSLAGAVQVRVTGYEADDVIATFVRRGGDEFTIHSNDGDFVQLGVAQDPKPSLTERVEPKWVRLYKTIVGDASDHIPGVKGAGKGTWGAIPDYASVAKAFETRKNVSFDEWFANGFSRVSSAWLVEPENFDMVCGFYQIIGLIDVPFDAITDGMIAPRKNLVALEAICAKYLMN